MINLAAALLAFLLLPGLHVLVHDREAAQAEQAQALHAARALHFAHVHDPAHAADAHDEDLEAPHQHHHPGDDKSDPGHGRRAPEHCATALTLAAATLLPPPATLQQPIDPSILIDRLPAHPKVRSHATRGPPRA